MDIPGIKHSHIGNLLLIAGPCVIESRELVFRVAEEEIQLAEKYKIPLIFKASYRKANRSKLDSFTGIGDIEALEILKAVGDQFDVPVTTDIHSAEEALLAASYVDMIQIPAFLCRQTDILIAAGSTGKWVNVKKGQFLSAGSMRFAVEKVRSTGNDKIMLTERGNMFGYNDLIVDFRNIPELRKNNVPVIVDITHSLQQPNQPGGVTGGKPEMIETLGMAAVAAGADGIFLETHPYPEKALSDGANMLPLRYLDSLLKKLTSIRQSVKSLNN